MQKLKGSLNYLCGPMDRIPDAGIGWRQKITPFFHSLGIGVLDPTQKPTFEAFEDENTRNLIHRLKKEGKFEEVRALIKPIIRSDLRMVDIAHFLIMYVDVNFHSCGSYWEACHAGLQRKPILVIAENGISELPNWLFGLIDDKEMFNSIEECCNYISKINSGEYIPSNKTWKFFNFSKIYGENND